MAPPTSSEPLRVLPTSQHPPTTMSFVPSSAPFSVPPTQVPGTASVSTMKVTLAQDLHTRGPAPPIPHWVLASLHTLAQQYPRGHFGVQMQRLATQDFGNYPLRWEHQPDGRPGDTRTYHFWWFPRILCYDCQRVATYGAAMSFALGGGTGLGAFEVLTTHLSTITHIRNRNERASRRAQHLRQGGSMLMPGGPQMGIGEFQQQPIMQQYHPLAPNSMAPFQGPAAQMMPPLAPPRDYERVEDWETAELMRVNGVLKEWEFDERQKMAAERQKWDRQEREKMKADREKWDREERVKLKVAREVQKRKGRGLGIGWQ